MAEEGRGTLAEGAARQLANATKTRAQWGGITPRWLIPFLPWTPVEAGIYRVNKVKETRGDFGFRRSSAAPADGRRPARDLRRLRRAPARVLPQPVTPRSTCRRASPISIAARWIRCGSSSAAHRDGEGASGERADQQHGTTACSQHARRRCAPTRKGPPTPDDLDELSPRLEGAGVLPRAPARHRRLRARVHASRRAAADGHALRLAVPHLARPPAHPVRQAAADASGSPRSCSCARARRSRASSACSSREFPGEVEPSLSVRFMGIDRRAASYLVSLYCSLAVLTEDALGVLEDVEVGNYHDYPAAK